MYPCTRLAFIDILSKYPETTEKIANAVFHGRQSVHKAGQMKGKRLDETTLVFFAKKNNPENSVRLSELVTIMFNSKCKFFNQEKAIGSNIRFSLDI